MKNLHIKSQNGMVLIISTIILVCVLFLTLSNMNSTIDNRKMTSNIQSRQQARAAAEAAILHAEKMLSTTAPVINSATEDCTGGLCIQQTLKNIKASTQLWNKSTDVTSIKGKAKLVENPKYLIEYIGQKSFKESISVGSEYGDNQDNTTAPIYRVTGKAKGKDGKKDTLIQSTIY